jgi:molybdenum cofactor synthesis domain-containing protein
VPLPVARSAGWTLATDLFAAEALPPFDQSAVDGYAFSAISDADGAPVAGVIRAGDPMRPLPSGGALRVMTGAPVPFGADRVAMQEQCQRSGDRVFPPPLAAGANVRRRGEDVCPGDLLARAGTRLDARHVALFAASGHVMVPCLRPLRVAVLPTGDELSDRPSNAAGSGRIRDSNTPMLVALLASAPDLDVQCDDAEVLTEQLRALSLEVDLIITSGGMFFGPEDHVSAAVFRLGGKFEIAGVAMKPGEPVRLARLGNALLLGLTGQPVCRPGIVRGRRPRGACPPAGPTCVRARAGRAIRLRDRSTTGAHRVLPGARVQSWRRRRSGPRSAWKGWKRPARAARRGRRTQPARRRLCSLGDRRQLGVPALQRRAPSLSSTKALRRDPSSRSLKGGVPDLFPCP